MYETRVMGSRRVGTGCGDKGKEHVHGGEGGGRRSGGGTARAAGGEVREDGQGLQLGHSGRQGRRGGQRQELPAADDARGQARRQDHHTRQRRGRRGGRGSPGRPDLRRGRISAKENETKSRPRPCTLGGGAIAARLSLTALRGTLVTVAPRPIAYPSLGVGRLVARPSWTKRVSSVLVKEGRKALPATAS